MQKRRKNTQKCCKNTRKCRGNMWKCRENTQKNRGEIRCQRAGGRGLNKGFWLKYIPLIVLIAFPPDILEYLSLSQI